MIKTLINQVFKLLSCTLNDDRYSSQKSICQGTATLPQAIEAEQLSLSPIAPLVTGQTKVNVGTEIFSP